MDIDPETVGTTVAKIVGKAALNACVPGLSATVDFAEAVVDINNGNYLNAGLNVVSGIFDIFSVGLWGAYKDTAKQVGKKAATSTVKASVKEATRKIGRDAAKEIAKGAPKTASKHTAMLMSQKAAKEIGKKYSIELGKGMLEETVERAAWEVTQGALNKQLQQSTFTRMIEAGVTEIGEVLLNSVPKQTFTSAKALASKAAATEYLIKANQKMVIMDVASTATKTYLEKTFSD